MNAPCYLDRAWILELVMREKVVVEEAVSIFLQKKHRDQTHLKCAVCAGRDGGGGPRAARAKESKIDRLTILRLTNACVEEGKLVQLTMSDPLAKDGGAANRRRQVKLLALPGVASNSSDVSKLGRTIAAGTSWDSYLNSYKMERISDVAAAGAFCQQCKNPMVSTPILMGAPTVGRVADGVVEAELLQEVEGIDGEGHDVDGVGSLAMRIGYIPGRAIRAQRLHALLIEHSTRIPRASSCATGEAGELGADDWPALEFSSLLQQLKVPDYALLCGLGAMPPTPHLLLVETRKDLDFEAIQMCQLPTALHRFFFDPGPQLNKATERLALLLKLLAMLDLIVPDETTMAAGPHGVPLKFRIAQDASHSQLSADIGASRGEGLDRHSNDEPGDTGRTFDMRTDEVRAEYWETLKVICADILPRRASRGGSRDATASHALHSNLDSASATGRRSLEAQADLPSRAYNILAQLREVQWSTVRPLTSVQRHRLLQRAPDSMPETQDKLVWWADELEVHPLQLVSFMQRTQAGALQKEKKGRRQLSSQAGSEYVAETEAVSADAAAANAFSDTFGRSTPPVSGAASAATDAARSISGGASTSGIRLSHQRIKRRRAVPATSGASHGPAHARAPALPTTSAVSPLLHPPKSSKAWHDDEREALLSEYAKQLLLIYDSEGHAQEELPAHSAKTVETALAALNARVDWEAVGKAVGGRLPMNCRSMISRGILARGSNALSSNGWRKRIAILLARALRAGNIGTRASSGGGGGMLDKCFAMVVEHLGVDVGSGAVDSSKHESHVSRLQPESARQAALVQRLLAMMTVAEGDYCPRLGSESLSPFTIEETQEVTCAPISNPPLAFELPSFGVR